MRVGLISTPAVDLGSGETATANSAISFKKSMDS
jgi:hypothetical protein